MWKNKNRKDYAMKTEEKILAILLLIFIGLLSFRLVVEYSYKPEDVNHDGKVDIKDLLKVQKYIIEEKEND